LELLAHEATWLSVSSDGKPVFSGILAENQSKTVASPQNAEMRVGNAAGIEVRLKRQAAWSAGPSRASPGGGVQGRQFPDHAAGEGPAR